MSLALNSHIGFLRLWRYMFVQHFIKLKAAVHKLSCDNLLPYLAMVRNPKILSCIWISIPITTKI